MRFATILPSLAVLARASLTLGATFSIPLDLRDLDVDNLNFEGEDLEPWDLEDEPWDLEEAPPGVKVPGSNPLYLCRQDDSADILKITKVDFSPEQPVRGSNLVVSASGSIAQAITKGTTVRVQIRLAGSKVFDKKYELCDGLKKFGHKCPFPAGTADITKGFMVPKKIPHGHYSARIKVDTPDKKQVTCFVASLKI